MSLAERVGAALGRPIDPAVAAFAAALGEQSGASAVLFYGSNLRTGSLDGDAFQAEFGDRFILDGEAFPAGRYRLSLGPKLRFVVP